MSPSGTMAGGGNWSQQCAACQGIAQMAGIGFDENSGRCNAAYDTCYFPAATACVFRNEGNFIKTALCQARQAWSCGTTLYTCMEEAKGLRDRDLRAADICKTAFRCGS